MTRIAAIFILPLILVVLGHCGRDRAGKVTSVTPPGPQPSPHSTGPASLKKVHLYLFAAGHCLPCQEELPALAKWYRELSKERQEQVMTRVYVTAGDSPADTKPTQGYAENYGRKFNLPFEMKADRFQATCRSYYEGLCNVPSTVVTNESGTIWKAIVPRKVAPEEVEQIIQEVIQKEETK